MTAFEQYVGEQLAYYADGEEAARESPNLYWRVVDTMADDD